MSKYTSEIRFICESKIGLSSSLGYETKTFKSQLVIKRCENSWYKPELK